MYRIIVPFFIIDMRAHTHTLTPSHSYHTYTRTHIDVKYTANYGIVLDYLLGTSLEWTPEHTARYLRWGRDGPPVKDTNVWSRPELDKDI